MTPPDPRAVPGPVDATVTPAADPAWTRVDPGRGDPGPADAANQETVVPSAGTRPDVSAGATQATVVPPVGAFGNPPAATPAGTTFGRYELLGELARGGMGVVYRARQHGLDRTVALKMILGAGVDADTAGRFLREAQAAAALDHPNVVPVYDSGEEGGRPFFTMALVDGPNLRDYVVDHGVPPLVRTAVLFTQIVAGVAHAHRHGIVHRDLKPANVLIDRDGRPRVTDFGLAKRVTANAHLTATGQVVGTPAYMAPEQARDSKDVGPPADVYALGAILYFLLTGRPPFEGAGVTDLLIKVVTEAPAPPRGYNPTVPAELEALCLACLAKSPADRPADADALAVAFAAAAAPFLPVSTASLPVVGHGLPAGLSPVDPSRADRRPASAAAVPFPAAPPAPALPATAAPPGGPAAARRKRSLTAGLVAAAVVLGGVVVFFAARGGKSPDPGRPPEPTAEAPPPAPPAALFPPPTRTDFGLKVDLTAPAARAGAEGVIRLSPGAPMQIHLRADVNCRVAVWAIDPAGHPARLFPNDDDPDDRLTAGVGRVIPGDKPYTLEATPTDGAGAERLRVLATTGVPPAYPPGSKVGRYTFYSSDQDREKLASAVRGVVIKKAPAGGEPAGAVSEAELLFRVER